MVPFIYFRQAKGKRDKENSQLWKEVSEVSRMWQRRTAPALPQG